MPIHEQKNVSVESHVNIITSFTHCVHFEKKSSGYRTRDLVSLLAFFAICLFFVAN